MTELELLKKPEYDAGADWLDERMDRAEKTVTAFYLFAAFAVSGLFIPIKWLKSFPCLGVARKRMTNDKSQMTKSRRSFCHLSFVICHSEPNGA